MEENVKIQLVKNGSAYSISVDGLTGSLHEVADVTEQTDALNRIGSILEKMNLNIIELHISANSAEYEEVQKALDKIWNNAHDAIRSLKNREQTKEPEVSVQVASPMMKQFFELKEKHPEALLLFRCGDFYESYMEDAQACAEILGITLTKRTNSNVNMAGFPHHALDVYLPKLIRAGKRVAICDEITTPTGRISKKRKISELVSPGEDHDLFTNSENEEGVI